MSTIPLPFVDGIRRRAAGGRPHRNLTLDHAEEIRLVRGPFARAGMIALLVLYVILPLQASDYVLSVLVLSGIYAIGAIGLNLLIGYTGQVSLGHAALFGVGAYTAVWFGARWDWPFLAYLPLAFVFGVVLGGIIGPFALRLRGNYLAVVTLGLLFIGEHVFTNWRSLSGGGAGTSVAAAEARIGPLDFEGLDLGGQGYTRDQSMFWLVWALVALTALLVKNIVRSRTGRALQAVRDRDLSAEIIGVSLAWTKIGAFAVSSGIAAMAGALYGLNAQYVLPGDFGGSKGLFLSITFVAMIIIGGIGTVFGSILGALVVWGGQQMIARNSDFFLFDLVIQRTPRDDGLVSIGEFNNILFGLIIVLFLLAEPRGLAALWFRVKAYFQSWPFSY